MTRLTTLTGLISTGALLASLGAALAQDTTAQQEGMADQEQSMRSMMREMMQEMMQDQGRGPAGDRAMGRPQRPEMGRGPGPGYHHMKGRHDSRHRHPMRMQIVFAILDADGNGGVSLQEAQDFQARIFRAVDADDDGEVTMEEIGVFFHGEQDMPPR